MIRLLELRNERGLSQRQMAKEMHVSQGTYNNWENGNTQPSIEQLIELARFFEVSIDFMVGNSDDYGTDFTRPLSKAETRLLTRFNCLDDGEKETLLAFIEKFTEKK